MPFQRNSVPREMLDERLGHDHEPVGYVVACRERAEHCSFSADAFQPDLGRGIEPNGVRHAAAISREGVEA